MVRMVRTRAKTRTRTEIRGTTARTRTETRGTCKIMTTARHYKQNTWKIRR